MRLVAVLVLIVAVVSLWTMASVFAWIAWG